MTNKNLVLANQGLGVLLMCFALVLSGCVQTLPKTAGIPLTPEEERMREQGKAFNKTVIEGAVAGAVLGAVAGALIRRDLQGALIGGVSGALVGGTTGYYLAEKQKQYANAEQRTDAMIADVRADNQRVSELIASSRKVIAADKERIKQVEKQIAAGKISKENAQRELARVEENEKYLQNTVSNLKKRQGEWQDISKQAANEATPRQKKQMDSEINKLEKQIVSLEKELDTLVQRRKVLPVA